MRVKVLHSDGGQKDRLNAYATQLLYRTLESCQHRILSVDVKVSPSNDIALYDFYYHCTVSIHMTNGRKINTDAQDRDEILAIYCAVDKAKHMIEHLSNFRFKDKNESVN